MGWIGQQDNHWVTRRIDLSADSRWDVRGDGRWNDLVAGTRRVEFRVQTVAGTRYGTDKVISRRTLDRWNMTWGALSAEGRWDATWDRWDGSMGRGLAIGIWHDVDWKKVRAAGFEVRVEFWM